VGHKDLSHNKLWSRPGAAAGRTDRQEATGRPNGVRSGRPVRPGDAAWPNRRGGRRLRHLPPAAPDRRAAAERGPPADAILPRPARAGAAARTVRRGDAGLSDLPSRPYRGGGVDPIPSGPLPRTPPAPLADGPDRGARPPRRGLGDPGSRSEVAHDPPGVRRMGRRDPPPGRALDAGAHRSPPFRAALEAHRVQRRVSRGGIGPERVVPLRAGRAAAAPLVPLAGAARGGRAPPRQRRGAALVPARDGAVHPRYRRVPPADGRALRVRHARLGPGRPLRPAVVAADRQPDPPLDPPDRPPPDRLARPRGADPVHAGGAVPAVDQRALPFDLPLPDRLAHVAGGGGVGARAARCEPRGGRPSPRSPLRIGRRGAGPRLGGRAGGGAVDRERARRPARVAAGV